MRVATLAIHEIVDEIGTALLKLNGARGETMLDCIGDYLRPYRTNPKYPGS